jgi:hypothetical protein
MAEQTAQERAAELKEQYNITGAGTTEDVQNVLRALGEPGVNLALKREVVGLIFTQKSFQHHSVVDSIGSYPEF